MAISVKDIQEKEFTEVATGGYDVEQVDDFLDELAEQWGAMIRENLALGEQVKQLQESLDAAEADKVEMEKKLPDYNEKGYFQNLESAMRESLIGAQRIADEAVTEAKKKAQQALDDAKAQAEKTVAEADEHAKSVTEKAQQVVDDLGAEAERLRTAISGYKAKLKSLIDEQLASLSGDDEEK